MSVQSMASTSIDIPSDLINLSSTSAAAGYPVIMFETTTSSSAYASTSISALGTTSVQTDTFNNANLMFNVNIFLLCILALFFLRALPSAVVRFSHLSGWTEGMFFRNIVQSNIPRPFTPSAGDSPAPIEPPYAPTELTAASPDKDYAEKTTGKSDEGHIIYSSQVHPACQVSAQSLPFEQSHNPPRHMPSLSSMMPFMHKILLYAVRPGYSVGKTMVLLVYTGVMLFAGLYKSNPFSDPVRSGYVSASQFPFIIILAMKNNIIGWLVGCGYEKLNFLHRLAGRLAILAVNIHSIGYMYVFIAEGSFWEIMAAHPTLPWGFVGLIAADILFLLSTSIARQICYPMFYISHILMAILFVFALCIHAAPWAAPYVTSTIVFYAFDRVLRVVRSRYVVANLCALPELAMTRVEVPTVNAGWRAGQHVRIKVLSLGMGWLGWAEAHPFTIASVSQAPGDEGLVLLCKKTGDWTNKLFELAMRGEEGEVSCSGRSVRVIIDGPYGMCSLLWLIFLIITDCCGAYTGGPGHSVPSSYSGAMFVAGGSGITYALASVRELVHRATQGRTHVGVIELIWSVTDPVSLVPLLPLFTGLLAESEHSSTRLRISVFYTRALLSSEALEAVQPLPSGLTLSAGRPKLNKVLEDVIVRTCGRERDSVGPLSGVVAGVCGSLALGEELARAVRSIPAASVKAVGGIELHNEIFGW
ncbi:incomplete iron reductase [Amylocystis lapponica]|nr:incomplete iron reductase [Amylocystis lapponica]